MTTSQSLADSIEESRPFSLRSGMPHLGQKLRNRESITIVFIGGSITRGGGEHGYVKSTEKWLKETYTNTEITCINAGVNGTDSRYGAKRYDRDVLAHKPDAVFIEFAVNDGARDHTEHMERMVHKTWMCDPNIDITFFYTLAQQHLSDYTNGLLPPAARAHEIVAEHYSIPTIGLGHIAADLIAKGTLEWNTFSRDGCHPTEEGYALYNKCFKKILPRMFAHGQLQPHVLRKPLTEDLVVYPPPLKIRKHIVTSFITSNGIKAVHSYSLPTPGVHWINESAFTSDDGKALWQLYWMPRMYAEEMDTKMGRDKTFWSQNSMVWFREDKSFTGDAGSALFTINEENEKCLGFSEKDVAVLTFIAPKSGTYSLRVEADSIRVWKQDDKDFALHILHFPWGKNEGRSIALFRKTKKDINPFMIEKTCEMLAGEELAFIVGTDAASYVCGAWENLRIHIGLMKEKESQRE